MHWKATERPQSPLTTGIAVLCRHNLSSLEPGEKVHVYNKIMALAESTALTLFIPYGHARKEMWSRMNIVQVSPGGLRFVLTLVPTLIARRGEYDSIYSRDLFLILLAAPMKTFGKKLVIELNGMPSVEVEIQRETRKVRQPKLTPLICGLVRLSEILAFRSADLVLSVTEKMRNIVRKYGADAKNIFVVPNAVDTTIFKPLDDEGAEIRRGLGIGKGTVVLFISSFSVEWRGSNQLFQVMDLVQRKRSDIVFLIVGSGPLLGEMKAEIAKTCGSSRALFTGAIDPNLVPLYINAADVYVHDVTQLASKLMEKEGLCPTKILEAMACGKPVIAPKETELEAMLRRSNGGFCAVSMEEVSALIEKFADSPELARSMGEDAMEYVKLNHDLTGWARLTIELINEMSLRSKKTEFIVL